MHLSIKSYNIIYDVNGIGCFSPGVVDWPTINKAEILGRRTALTKHIIQWKIYNYSEFLVFTFTEDDGTVIYPNKNGYSLWLHTCDFSAICLQLKLPYFFHGRVKLNATFNASVIVRDAENNSVSSASPQVSPWSKTQHLYFKLFVCFTSMYLLYAVPRRLCL